MTPCLTPHGGASRLAVAVVPNARTSAADGMHDGALRVRLAAPPLDGRANEALRAWLAAQLRVPQRAVRLVRGASSRRKAVEIDLPPADVEAWLARVLEAA
jgi:uncharacterized protein YggU (UPF0235/DUF167 family)